MATHPIHKAARKGDVKEVERLVLAGTPVDISDRGWSPLHCAAKFGKAEVIEALMRLGSNAINTRDRDGLIPVFLAAMSANFMSVTVLRALGSIPLTEDEDEAHEVRWRVYFRESFVEKLIREIK